MHGQNHIKFKRNSFKTSRSYFAWWKLHKGKKIHQYKRQQSVPSISQSS